MSATQLYAELNNIHVTPQQC